MKRCVKCNKLVFTKRESGMCEYCEIITKAEKAYREQQEKEAKSISDTEQPLQHLELTNKNAQTKTPVKEMICYEDECAGERETKKIGEHYEELKKKRGIIRRAFALILAVTCFSDGFYNAGIGKTMVLLKEAIEFNYFDNLPLTSTVTDITVGGVTVTSQFLIWALFSLIILFLGATCIVAIVTDDKKRRLAKEKRLAEEKRAEEERKWRLEEEHKKLDEEKRRAELERLKQEEAAEKKRVEEERLTEEIKIAQEKERLEEEKQIAEEKRISEIKRLAAEKDKENSKNKPEFGKQTSIQEKNTHQTGLYPWLPDIKKEFSIFLPIFNAQVTLDENAWQYANTNHLFWTQDAIQMKRNGEYLEACKLYFSNIIANGRVTSGWGKGVFKTLAAAGDIEDALVFGHFWYSKFQEMDDVATHWAILSQMAQNKETLNKIPDYLQSISGNSSYSVDLKRTDLYTSDYLLRLRGETSMVEKQKEEEKKRKAEEEERRRQEYDRQRKVEEERNLKAEEARIEEERRQREIETEKERSRINTEGMEKVGSFYTKVVGVTFKNDDGSDRQRIIRNLIRNGGLEVGTELQLIPEPTNPYDRNCIRVVASNGQQIGCLSKEIAAKVAPRIANGSVYKAFVSSQNGGEVGYSYGINIHVEQYNARSVPTSNPPLRSSYGSDYSDYDVESIYDIARDEGFSIDDDGHWVPIEHDNDW